MLWKTHKEDREFCGEQNLSIDKLAEILSKFPEFQGYTIGEDIENQLIIYTGLYRDSINEILEK